MTTVLFLGGGRRVSLAERFAARGCAVLGYELDTRVPLAAVGKVLLGHPWASPDFGPHLRQVAAAYRVDLVVPLDDAGVVALAQESDLPCPRACPPADAARACYDKGLFETAVVGHFGFDDAVYPFAVDGRPAVVKPRRGCGSKGVRRVDRFERVSFQWDGDAEVAQRELSGPEFSVDCFYGPTGSLVGASPRERLRVAGGEVVESRTVDRPDLVELCRRLGRALGLHGAACLQFMGDADGRCRVIEANARFGGGSTLSCAAGLDLVGLTLDHFLGGSVPLAGVARARPGVFMTRAFRDSFFVGCSPFREGGGAD